MLLNKCKECIFRNKPYFLTYRSIFLKSFWIVPNGGTTEHLNLTASNSKIMRKKEMNPGRRTQLRVWRMLVLVFLTQTMLSQMLQSKNENVLLQRQGTLGLSTLSED